jgi:hypothetical protein
LPFLDCSVFKNNNKFETSVFRKTTFTGLGMSFFSFCPISFKMNSIKTLLHRGYSISSNYLSVHKELTFLKSFFFSNGFPYPAIDHLVKKFLDRKFDPPRPIATVNKRKYFVSLPYFGPQSEKLRKELESLFIKFYVQIDFKIILVNKFTIGSLFTYKDTLPKCLRSSVVYKFSCAQCASEYVGSTTRTLRTRIAEHAGRSFRTGNLLAKPPHSSIRSHAEKCDVPVTLDDFTILCNTSDQTDLRIMESLFIHQHRPLLNDTQSSFPLKIVNN